MFVVQTTKLNKRDVHAINFLLNSFEGSYPLNRSFGISPDVIDEVNDVQAFNKLSIEITMKLNKFFPQVSVKKIERDENNFVVVLDD